MLLIYVHKITPRVTYSFRHICKRILGLEVDFTSKIETFIAHDGPKFSYGKQPLREEFYFQSVDLLFERGLNDIEIKVFSWEDTKCFYKVKNIKSALPFDIFAATFYLLSRYEEYQPHIKDDLGRFMAVDSIGFVSGFLEDPVVDIWAYKFKDILLKRYPNIKFEDKKFSCIPLVSVSETFAYKRKGMMRSIGGAIRDLWQLKFIELTDRFKVLMNFKKDPYDTFDFMINMQKKHKGRLKVLFGLGDYSHYEKNISHNDLVHKSIIKHVADYVDVGLKISYEAISDLLILKKEKIRAESIINQQVRISACSFSKIKLPEAYRNFVELEIEQDYSMGYVNKSGFRAGTCTPFLFYDIDYEVQTPLIVYSFCFRCQDHENNTDENSIKSEMISYYNKVKKVNGVFIPIFSNRLFGEMNNQVFWESILEFVLNIEDN